METDMGVLDDLRYEMDELREEADYHRNRAADFRDEAEAANKRADAAESLVYDLINNLNGDLVKVWQDHRHLLATLGYK